jgi:transposase
MRFAAPPARGHQQVLFAPSLDEAVAADDGVRAFDALMEAVDWAPWEAAYAGCGQPPIHPRYLASALLYGLLKKKRSSRELEEAARVRLDFMWLLDGFGPDHSTFAQFRVRHAAALKALGVQVARAVVEGRARPLDRLLVDGTRVLADSSRDGTRTARQLEALVAELERRMARLAAGDAREGVTPEETADPAQELERLHRHRQQCLQALQTARERDARARAHDGKNAKAVRVPVSDPDARVLPNKEGGFAPNYTPTVAVDAHSGAIVHADVVAGADEASAVAPAVEAARALTGRPPEAVVADGNFAAGEVLQALDEAHIDAYMPTRSASPPDNPARRDDPAKPVAEADRKGLPKQGRRFARTAFVYDAQADAYYCPMGHVLTPYQRTKNPQGVPCTYYRGEACPACPLARDCIKGKAKRRTLTRDAHEPLREAADQRMATDQGRAIYRTRAPGVEGVFAYLKAALGFRRFLVRGLDKVRIEWDWVCTAYNIHKLLTRRAAGRRPHPQRPGLTAPPAPKQPAPHRRLAPTRPRRPTICHRPLTKPNTPTCTLTIPTAATA